MNKKLILGSLSMMALLAVSCGTTNKNNVSDTVAEASSKAVDVEGQWGIVSVVVNDTLSVNPGENDRPGEPYILFKDGDYYVATGCNSIRGSYTLSGDSIAMGAGASTMMACPDMRVEDMVKMVLPEILTVDLVNDSVMRLNSGASAYISLLRSNMPVE